MHAHGLFTSIVKAIRWITGGMVAADMKLWA